MTLRALSISGAFEFTPRQFGDERGTFMEWFKSDALADAIGHRLELAQANCSVSSRGVLRGIHFSDVPPGQAKYVTCVRGSVLDVVVDTRVGSPTFGSYEFIRLDDVDRRAVYLSEGLGHGFIALEDDATVMYLCSTGYAPDREHGIHPLDPALAIEWPEGLEPILSAKDSAAPSLAQAQAQGLLPTFAATESYLAVLNAR